MPSKRGFKFAETMSGSYARVESPGEDRPLSFSIVARAPSVAGYLRDRRVSISGTMEAPGLADHVPIEGSMLLDPIGKRIIGYEFNFTGNDGQPYHFSGQKDIKLAHPVRSFTELPAHILDNMGDLVATSRTRFNLRSDWLPFLLSWRLQAS